MTQVKTQARLPLTLHQWLTERARRNDRSMNAELVRILREAKEEETEEHKPNEGV